MTTNDVASCRRVLRASNALKKARSDSPKDIDGDRRKLVLKPTALAMLTDGIDLQRPWDE